MGSQQSQVALFFLAGVISAIYDRNFTDWMKKLSNLGMLEEKNYKMLIFFSLVGRNFTTSVDSLTIEHIVIALTSIKER